MSNSQDVTAPTAQNYNPGAIKEGQLTDPNAIAAILQSHPEICQLFSQTPHSGTNREKERINDRLHGFDPKDNIAWKEITKRFGTNIKQPELLSIAEVLANYANVKLDRDAKRRKTVLIKWFSENWPLISPYLHYVVLEDSQK
ncbi:hypothetical protein GPJ56_007276 [Histomonas meleagridis]|uniref:uncharacterized protein n=1 Tax=Histomonas meleagridis TaxID=135588 RepID=UPI00355A435B|nr:hypothetical protein GPJ56_007276 [Histomonas meleagridis]KAH0804122.1 hypothetical protein GO595_002952 [Histomonas meleagridis]